MRNILISALFAAFLGLAGEADAQGTIPWWVMSSGGGRTTGTSNAVRATVGQVVTGNAAGSQHQLVSGYWAGSDRSPSGTPEDEIRYIPTRFKVGLPRPNPTDGNVAIRLELAEAASVSVGVFDVAGRLVRVLSQDQWLQPGVHETKWDGRSDVDARAPVGVYWLRLVAGEHVEMLRITVVR